MRPPSPAMQRALDTVPEGCRVVCVMIPTRVIRVLQIDAEGHAFRVEQMIAGGMWRALSTHTNAAEPWGAYYPALEEAIKANAKLKAALLQKARERQRTVLHL